MSQRKRDYSLTTHLPTARQEVDALIRKIGSLLNEKPEKVVKVLEFWVNEPRRSEQSTPKKKTS